MLTISQTREYTRCKKLNDFLTINQTAYASLNPLPEKHRFCKQFFGAG